MHRLIRALAFALAFFPSLAAAQSGPPVYTTMADGTKHGNTPTLNWCSADGGLTWVPCPPAIGPGSPGGSTTTTSTANAPTQTEGSTTNAFSTDNNGYLRVRAKQDGTWNFGVLDGGDVTLGLKADAKCTSTDATACSVIALLKGQIDRQQAVITALGSTLSADNVIKATSVDRGAIVGTSAVTLAAINTLRRGWAIQVQAASSVSCYVNGTAAATADYHSLQVGGGGYYQTPDGHVGTGALSVICSAAGTSVYMREW